MLLPKLPPSLPWTHIIWDWNGTLMDDLWLCVESINSVLGKRGLPRLTEDDLREKFEFPVTEYYKRIGLNNSRQQFEAASAEFISLYEIRRKECNLQDGAIAALREFQRIGLKQSILSAYLHCTLLEIVEFYGIAECFDFIQGQSDIYGNCKEELGRSLMIQMSVSPRDVLLIGDTVHDCEVARELGTDCILISHGHHSASRLRKTNAPTFSSISEAFLNISNSDKLSLIREAAHLEG